MSNTVVTLQSIKACVTRHDVMAIANYMQKGTTTAKIFKNDSVTAGWYQNWISLMIAMGIIKNSSGTIPHDVTREALCTSSKLEASYSLYASELVKISIAEYNNSYDENVKGSEEIIVTHPLHLICYDKMRFKLTKEGTRTSTTVERNMRVSEGNTVKIICSWY